ncbi:hypothetical protein F5Y10DRAFT_273593 [Nemania abortiva]|nr:hypothetical protein F5Y10DRAFT_273593 [Nemania abortiva]
MGKIFLGRPEDHRRTHLVYAPAHQHVEYELSAEHGLDHHTYSKYSGSPTAEQDAAWDKLIRPSFFNATYEELERAGEWSERVAELTGGGYPATIGRRMRLYLFKERYYPNLTKAQDDYIHGHLDHCIESLRLTIMCYGNTAMYSFAWDDPPSWRPSTKSKASSVCAKWSSIEEWGRSRMIPTNPDYHGPPDGLTTG